MLLESHFLFVLAITSTLCVSLRFLLIIINVCFASSFNPVEQGVQLAWLQGSVRLSKEQQRYPLRFRRECPLENLKTLEPFWCIEAEAGYTVLWDENDEQFVCARSAALRHVIRHRGLLRPSYTSSSARCCMLWKVLGSIGTVQYETNPIRLLSLAAKR